MKVRSRSWSVVLLVLLVALAGCSTLTGKGPIEASASPATVSESALSATGYTEVEVRTYAVNRSITIGNRTRHVNVTNHVAVYRKNYSGGVPAAFGVLSTPQVEVVGQGINPLGHLGKKALMKQVLTRVQNVRNLKRTGTRTVTMFGNETTMTTFSGTATYAGQTREVTAYFVRTQHGGDYVIAGGIHVAGLESGASDVTRLIRGIQHQSG